METRRAGWRVFGVVLIVHFEVGAWWNKMHPKPPPPVVVALPQNPALLKVYPGQMGFHPARWFAVALGPAARPNHPRSAAPERVGTNSSWASIAMSYNRSAGLSSNGTLWDAAQYVRVPMWSTNADGTPQNLGDLTSSPGPNWC